MKKIPRRGAWRAWFLWFATLLSCYPLVRRPSHPFVPDIPGGERFPDGTRGMVVARDTLWAGEIRWSPDTLFVDGKAFSAGTIRCMAYRFPSSYRPTSLQSEALVGAVLGGVLTILPWTSGLFRCPDDLACGFLFPLFFPMVAGASVMGVVLMGYSLSYPRLRAQQGLYRYAFSSDPVQQARCAEILHFYAPLLDSTGTFVISLK